MFLEIPKNFTFYNDSSCQSNYAYEENGKLIITGNVSFKRLMYSLTYALNDSKKCYYCNCLLNENTRTIDHLYSQMFGGISIPPNMVPCCTNCNNKKSNLTESQFKKYTTINNQKKKRKYALECVNQMEKSQYSRGFFLPEEWIIEHNNSKILVKIDLNNTSYRGKKYKEIKKFYNKYCNLPRPIVISQNNFLLNGFLILMFAKERGISHVPTIILENVICR